MHVLICYDDDDDDDDRNTFLHSKLAASLYSICISSFQNLAVKTFFGKYIVNRGG